MASDVIPVILAISGLASILIGIFLLASSTARTSLRELLFGDNFPIAVAALLFLFNGLALFCQAASSFSDYPQKYYWDIMTYNYLYPVTHPLILLFAFYYPKPFREWLGRPKVKLAIIAGMALYLVFYFATSMAFKEWYYMANYSRLSAAGYPELYRLDPTKITDIMYYAGMISLWVIFAGKYRSGETTDREKSALALLLIGFLFGPINRLGAIMEWKELVWVGDWLSWILEFALAAAIGGYLVYVSYREWKATGSLRDRNLAVGLGIPLAMMALSPLYVFSLDIDPYDLGFGIVRPACFAVAILQYRLFGINVTKRVMLYSAITLAVGFMFFTLKNAFQATLPELGFLTIFIVSVIFIPLSAVSNFLAEKLTPKIQGALRMPRDPEEFGGPLEVPKPLSFHLSQMWAPRKLVFIVIVAFFIELLETGLGRILDYPVVLSMVFVGILFSALDYVVEIQFREKSEKEASGT